MKNKGHLIKQVYEGSIAEEMGIEPGDILLRINNEEVQDIFDYRFMIKDEYVEVLIKKADGEEWLIEIEKDYDDDLGVEFENGLMSEYRSCTNQCIFCFIDQMPPGMRETLYFKDDDSRLSFLQGNYITLTNMKDKDVERIIKMQLAPINISVHTTNPKLRCKMLHNRFAGEKLKYIDKLYEGHVEMNGQIVCCKNVNDGKELSRTISDLAKYLPYMRSVSVVPAGLTKFREGLFPLEPYTKEDAGAVIDMVEGYQKEYFDKYGIHFVHASDEWYILAKREFPEEERYDGYIQLENGVGMMRLFINEFHQAYDLLLHSPEYDNLKTNLSRCVTVATGKLAYPVIKERAELLEKALPKLTVNVCCIENNFFGKEITVSGLITAQDLISQLKEKKTLKVELGDTLLIPSNMLRMGENVFLDDLTTEDVETALGMKIVPIDAGGDDFIESVINPEYSLDREDKGFVYIKMYEPGGTL